MKEFRFLIEYEYRKLLKKKMVWITAAIMGALSIFMACSSFLGNTYVEGKLFESHYQKIKKEQAYARALSGRRIDDELTGQMQESFSKVGDFDTELLYAEEAYQKHARPYEHLRALLEELTGTEYTEGLTADRLYSLRQDLMHRRWAAKKLTEGEIRYLEEQDEEVLKPFIYQYCGSYQRIGTMLQAMGVLITLFLAICIPGIFAEEHAKKTNQLLLACPFGKETLYRAKCFVGISFSICVSCLLLGLFIIPVFIFYGTDGFSAQLQLILPDAVWNISSGQMVLILLAIFIIVSVFQCVVCMLLSERWKSSVPVMAVVLGFMLFCLSFRIPGEYRVLSQLYSYAPLNILSVSAAFGCRTIPVFGHYLQAWKTVPLLYVIFCMVLLPAGKKQYINIDT